MDKQMTIWTRVQVSKAAIVAHGKKTGTPGTRAEFRRFLEEDLIPSYCQGVVAEPNATAEPVGAGEG